jgi:hypothetical protein
VLAATRAVLADKIDAKIIEALPGPVSKYSGSPPLMTARRLRAADLADAQPEGRVQFLNYASSCCRDGPHINTRRLGRSEHKAV